MTTIPEASASIPKELGLEVRAIVQCWLDNVFLGQKNGFYRPLENDSVFGRVISDAHVFDRDAAEPFYNRYQAAKKALELADAYNKQILAERKRCDEQDVRDQAPSVITSKQLAFISSQVYASIEEGFNEGISQSGQDQLEDIVRVIASQLPETLPPLFVDTNYQSQLGIDSPLFQKVIRYMQIITQGYIAIASTALGSAEGSMEDAIVRMNAPEFRRAVYKKAFVDLHQALLYEKARYNIWQLLEGQLLHQPNRDLALKLFEYNKDKAREIFTATSAH